LEKANQQMQARCKGYTHLVKTIKMQCMWYWMA